MDFAITDEQRMFKDEVLRFAKKEIVPRVQEHDLAGTVVERQLEEKLREVLRAIEAPDDQFQRLGLA